MLEEYPARPFLLAEKRQKATLPGGANKRAAGLRGFGSRPGAVHQKRGNNEPEGDYDRYENGSK